MDVSIVKIYVQQSFVAVDYLFQAIAFILIKDEVCSGIVCFVSFNHLLF